MKRRQRVVRWLLVVAGILLVLSGLTLGLTIGLLRASLPDLDGEFRVPGLRASVVIDRDDLGVPTLAASNRLDVIFSLGFVHGQDRFFQMDLSRRSAAGEIAALLGPPALDHDLWRRAGGMRRTATRALARLPPAQRELVETYTEGVNAGLASLGSRPPEYWALRVQPAPWRPEDSLLAVLAMALVQALPAWDHEDTLLRQAIGPEAFEFFYPRGTDWDAALDGSMIPAAPMPGPQVIDFRHGWELDDEALPEGWRRWVRLEGFGKDGFHAARHLWESGRGIVPGSNGWAVDGSVSSTGSAWVASDMHLAYSVPAPCYRIRMKWVEDGRDHDVVGLTMAGVPAVVSGSNGRVAWASTASDMDLIDQIVLELDPRRPERYQVPEGWAEFEEVTERIEVRGGEPVMLTTRWTIWGPVAANRSGQPVTLDGRPLVECNVFHHPDSLDLRFFGLALATDTEEALQIAAESGSPSINLMVGDREGKVGWTIAGRLPRRVGQAGSQVVSWADGANGWNGWLTAGEHPRLSSPAVGRVFSGNQRKLGSEAYLTLAAVSGSFGARARQIGDALAVLTNATAADMLAIQLDDRALLLEPWRELLLATLRHPNATEIFTNDLPVIVDHVSNWNGRATPDSVAYRLLRGFRVTCFEHVYEPLTVRAALLVGERSARFWGGAERTVWSLLEARPPHLLSPRFASYEDLLLSAVSEVIREMRAAHEGDLGRATWGARANRPVQHPFSAAIPALTRWLAVSLEGCSGGEDMPRVHNNKFGGSQRLVVSPGHEDQGLLHMIGGQSGHFLSPYYRAGHDAWVRGEPKPLLPGPTRHTLRLRNLPKP